MQSQKPLLSTVLKMIVPAGQASPSPPVGPALGQKGVKAMDFCKKFNEATSRYIPGIPIPVFLNIKSDKTFTFQLKTPPTSFLLKRATKVPLLSTYVKVGYISVKQLYEIAKIKWTDPNLAHLDLEQVFKCVWANARSYGLIVVR